MNSRFTRSCSNIFLITTALFIISCNVFGPDPYDGIYKQWQLRELTYGSYDPVHIISAGDSVNYFNINLKDNNKYDLDVYIILLDSLSLPMDTIIVSESGTFKLDKEGEIYNSDQYSGTLNCTSSSGITRNFEFTYAHVIDGIGIAHTDMFNAYPIYVISFSWF